MEIQEVLYANKDIFMRKRRKHVRPLDHITIDMTGWANNVNHNDDGIYSYSAEFIDDAQTKQLVVCTGMKSGGMKKLLSELRHRYNVVPLETTPVYVIGPKDAIKNTKVSHGAVSKCCVQALRYHGIKALDFYPTDKGNAGIRLESVLDEIVHQSGIASGYPLSRHTVFPRSVYHYDVAEKDCREGKIDIDEFY